MHVLTQSALLRALGWSLFNSLWQMSLLWAFYHLFLLVFKQLPARARHGLALLLLAAGFSWSAITFIATYLFTAGAPLSAGGQTALMGLLPGDLTSSPAFTAPGLQAILVASRGLAAEILPWCSSLYLLILAGLLVHYSGQYIRSRRIVREGLSPLAPDLDAFVATAGCRMGVRAKVSTYLSTLVQVPVTLGFLKPVILLPVSMVTQLTTAQIEAILVHELAHIRRKDYLLNLLITVIGLLFFFNPFARLLIGQLKKEREHCCDEAVLEFRYDPQAYVSALLSLARQQQQAGLALAAIGGGGEHLLLQRARKILQQKNTDDRPGPRPVVGLLLTVLFSVLLLGHTRSNRTNSFKTRPLSPVQTAGVQPILQLAPGQFGPDQLATRQLAPDQLVPFQANAMPGHPPIVRLETVSLVIINTPAAPPLAAASRTTAAHPHRHFTHAHPKQPSGDLLDAMLAEAVPLLATPGPATMLNPTFANLMETAHQDNRDFSMGKTSPAPFTELDPMADNAPFVPQSSFSFQYTDTLPPGEKLALMEEFSQKALHLQMSKIRQELKQQLFLLRSQEAALRRAGTRESREELNNTIDTKALRLLFREQLQVQRQYILNLKTLEQQLQKASRRLTIVYI